MRFGRRLRAGGSAHPGRRTAAGRWRAVAAVALVAVTLAACAGFGAGSGTPGGSGSGAGLPSEGGTPSGGASSESEEGEPPSGGPSDLAAGAVHMLDLGTSPYPPLVAADAGAGVALVGVQEAEETGSVYLLRAEGAGSARGGGSAGSGFSKLADVEGHLGFVALAESPGARPASEAAPPAALPTGLWIFGETDPDSYFIRGPLQLGTATLAEGGRAEVASATLEDCDGFHPVLYRGRALLNVPTGARIPFICDTDFRAHDLASGRTRSLGEIPYYGDYVFTMPAPRYGDVAMQEMTPDGGESLRIFHLDDGTESEARNPLGAVHIATWAPDGRSLAAILFERRADGSYDAVPGDDGPLDIGNGLVVLTREGEQEALIRTDQRVTAPTWSPDSRLLAMLDVEASFGSESWEPIVDVKGVWMWCAAGAAEDEAPGCGAGREVWANADPRSSYDIVGWIDSGTLVLSRWDTAAQGNVDVDLLALDVRSGAVETIATTDWNGASSALPVLGGVVFAKDGEVDFWREGRTVPLLRLAGSVIFADPLAQVGQGVLFEVDTQTRTELDWAPIPKAGP